MDTMLIWTKVNLLAIAIKAGRMLISQTAVVIYHVIAFLFLAATAIIVGNNIFTIGCVLALISYFVMDCVGESICKKWPGLFGLSPDELWTPRNYIWLMTLPVAILLTSSCLMYNSPIAFNAASSGFSPWAVVIERNANSMPIVVSRGEASFFIPYINRTSWFPSEETLTTIPILTTGNRKKIQGTAGLDFKMLISKNSVLIVYQRFGSNRKRNGGLRKAVAASLNKATRRYSLATLPPQIVIEDLTGAGIDFRKFGVKSGTIKVSDLHRYFETK